jgi:hypothetical protein
MIKNMQIKISHIKKTNLVEKQAVDAPVEKCVLTITKQGDVL